MYNFTILERMILESINKSDKTVDAIQADTGVDTGACVNVICSLLAKNLVVQKNNIYQFNQSLGPAIVAELNDRRNLTVEINTLVRECVKMSLLENQSSFKFKKVYMNEKEKKLLKAMLYNLETFLEGLKQNKGPTKEETFVFWGGENYAKAINAYIS
ncbi:MAG: hypothetical protein WEB87_02770 [Bacteriovoracaceae bacterium]